MVLRKIAFPLQGHHLTRGHERVSRHRENLWLFTQTLLCEAWSSSLFFLSFPVLLEATKQPYGPFCISSDTGHAHSCLVTPNPPARP